GGTTDRKVCPTTAPEEAAVAKPGKDLMAQREARLAWAFVLPALGAVVLIALFPLAWTVWESLHLHDLRMPWRSEEHTSELQSPLLPYTTLFRSGGTTDRKVCPTTAPEEAAVAKPGKDLMAQREARLAWAFVLPALGAVVLIALFPLAWTVWESLHLHDLRMPW